MNNQLTPMAKSDIDSGLEVLSAKTGTPYIKTADTLPSHRTVTSEVLTNRSEPNNGITNLLVKETDYVENDETDIYPTNIKDKALNVKKSGSGYDTYDVGKDQKIPIEIPYMKTELPLDKADFFKRVIGQGNSDNVKIVAKALDYINEYVADIVNASQNTVEYLFCRALQDGAINFQTGNLAIKASGLKDLNFNRSGNNTVTAQHQWDTPDGDPLKDIKEVTKSIKASGGGIPDIMFIGVDAYDALINNAKFQKINDIKSFNMADIQPKQGKHGINYCGNLYTGHSFVDIYLSHGFFVSGKAGTHHYIDPDTALLVSSQTLNPVMINGAVDIWTYDELLQLALNANAQSFKLDKINVDVF